ncbi:MULTISPECIES: response regulator [Desulfatibacillum]|jgi:DNA-binding NtrC family response regulator|uniref:Protein with response regulator receiver domain n=2 Tax=Desulfatibacillum TaxID=218207 RepID=B8FJS5_DESAL|nr:MULTISPECIES: response regulator [Desulfatibacillum]ACL02353.1 Protein with response regulator receiver domain [Desulfatibacillum aliphaticivorans]SHL13663.1 Response regulator receiver domain-containing protein [Desulfatibacillum alkenivorans DSM 16219]
MITDFGDQSIRCVIVDDDRAVGALLAELVGRDNVEVETFTDSRKAVEAIGDRPADIVITDLMMPDVDGLEVLSRAKESNPDVVVIIVTGHGTLESAIEAIKEGAYNYIRKPFKLQEMEICFNNAADKISLVRENKHLMWKLKEAYRELVKQDESQESPGIKESSEIVENSGSINFFATHLPGLHLMESARDQANQYERLENLTRWRKEGLLSEKEFVALKSEILKGIDEHA